MRPLIGALLLLSGVVVRAECQSLPSPAECDQTIDTWAGRQLPAQDDSLALVWYVINACGDKGLSAIARELKSRALLTEPDSGRVEDFFKLFYAVRFPELFHQDRR